MDINWNDYIIWVLSLLSFLVFYYICRDLVIGIAKLRVDFQPLRPYCVPGMLRPRAVVDDSPNALFDSMKTRIDGLTDEIQSLKDNPTI